MKVTLSEIKIYRETVEGIKPIIKSVIWNISKKRIIRSEQQEEGIQKNKDTLRSLWDISKCTNI